MQASEGQTHRLLLPSPEILKHPARLSASHTPTLTAASLQLSSPSWGLLALGSPHSLGSWDVTSPLLQGRVSLFCPGCRQLLVLPALPRAGGFEGCALSCPQR